MSLLLVCVSVCVYTASQGRRVIAFSDEDHGTGARSKKKKKEVGVGHTTVT